MLSSNYIVLFGLSILLLLSIFYIVSQKFYFLNNTKIKFINNSIYSIILVSISLYPFWIFGEFSAVGIYDEADSNIPIELSILNGVNQNHFIHNYFGGTIFKHILPSSHEFFSYIQIFLKIFEPQTATLIIRAFGIWLLFIITQISFFKYLNVKDKYSVEYLILSILAGLLSIYGQHENYLYSFGGMGWSITFSFCYFFVLVCNLSKQLKWLILIVISLIISSSITIVFFYISSVFIFFCFILFFKLNFIKILKQNFIYLIVTSLIIFLNSSRNLVDLFYIISEGSTFNNIDEQKNCNVYFFDFTKNNFQLSFSYILERIKILFQGYDFFLNLNLQTGKGFPLTFIFFIGSLVISIWRKIILKESHFLKIIFISFLIPHILQSLCFFSCLPLICRIRWEVIFTYTFPFYALILTVGIVDIQKYYKKKITNVIKYFFYLLLFFFIFLGVGNMQLKVISSLNNNGGWMLLNSLEKLKPKNYSKSYRSLSFNDIPKSSYLSYLGIYTADGTRFNYSKRFNIFWNNNLLDNQINKHKVRSTLSGVNYSKISNSILSSARFLNVRYIYSNHEIENKDFSLNKIIDQVTVKDLDNFLSDIFFISKIQLVPKIYIYEIENSWDRIFYPRKINYSIFKDSDLGYFNELKTLKRNTLLLPQNYKNNFKFKEVLGHPNIQYLETHNGFVIKNLQSSIIINHEYSEKWKAFCDEKKTSIFPVNGYMMLVNLLPDCTYLDILKE